MAFSSTFRECTSDKIVFFINKKSQNTNEEIYPNLGFPPSFPVRPVGDEIQHDAKTQRQLLLIHYIVAERVLKVYFKNILLKK